MNFGGLASDSVSWSSCLQPPSGRSRSQITMGPLPHRASHEHASSLVATPSQSHGEPPKITRSALRSSGSWLTTRFETFESDPTVENLGISKSLGTGLLPDSGLIYPARLHYQRLGWQ